MSEIRNVGVEMADKKSLFMGMAIGAGVALGIQEIVGLISGRRGGWHLDNWHGAMQDHPERFRTTHSVLEPEDSRTESYVPNAVHEDHSWLDAQNKPHGRRRFGIFRTPRMDQQRMSREAQRVADAESGSRTTTSTEAEMRRTGTDNNPVGYTRPTDVQGASGGEAPFIKENI